MKNIKGSSERFHVVNVLIIFFLSVVLPQAKDAYVWPTNASHALSSTFGEYRQGHYHSGLDIKTWNKSGYKVYAVESGYIEKIRVSNGGYGRVIYQRLKDGNTAVYAHLQRFADFLEDVVDKEQQKTGAYRIVRNFNPGEFNIRKGEVIAYTGDSGTMSPHLHFEIRNPQGIPVNPLKRFYSVEDHTIPVASALKIVPADIQSRVNGSASPVILPLIYSGIREFSPIDTIQIWGPFGVEISAYDKVRGLSNRYGVHRIEYFVDDSLMYSLQNDSVSFSESDRIKLEYVSSYREGEKRHFQRLYFVDEDFKYPSVVSGTGSVTALDEGFHHLKIVLSDQNGNTSTVRVVLIVAKNNPPRVKLESEGRETLVKVSGNPIANYRECYFRLFSLPGYLVPLTSPVIAEKTDSLWTYRIKGVQSGNVLEVKARENTGFNTLPAYLPADEQHSSTDSDLPVFVSEKNQILGLMRWKMKSNRMFSGRISFNLEYPDTIINLPVWQVAPREFEALPVELNLLEGLQSVSVHLSGSPEIYVRENFQPVLIYPETGGRILSPDGKCELFFDPGAVFYPISVWITKDDFPNPGDQRIIPRSLVYSLKSSSLPLRNNAVVSIQYLPITDDLDKLGIFSFDKEENRWNYVDSYVDPLLRIVSAKISSFADIAVFQDTLSPEIEMVRPADGGSYYAEDLRWIYGNLGDKESGIDDESLFVEIDGKRIFAEYHPYKRIFRYRFRKLISAGEHSLSVSVSDNRGNLSTQRATFFVKEATR